MFVRNSLRKENISIFNEFYHSHNKWKDSLKTRAAFSWISILTWIFGGSRSDSASTFFKIASASCFWRYLSYNWLFYILDKDNIISTSVSEAVEKIPTDEKDYRKCSFIVYFAQPQQLQRVDQHIANSINSCLPTRIHSV